MKCPTCGRPITGSCDACSGDPVRMAFARGGRISVAELRALAAAPKRRGPRANKFGNVPTWVDGIRFASKKEAARWGELRLLESAGQIRDLRRQVRYSLQVSSVDTTTYIADFVYLDVATDATVVEDAKGFKTPEYKLKAKMMLAQYGIAIKEV